MFELLQRLLEIEELYKFFILIKFMKIELTLSFLLTLSNCFYDLGLENEPEPPTEVIVHQMPSYPSYYHEEIKICLQADTEKIDEEQHPAMPFVRFASQYVQCKLAQEKELGEGKLIKASERFSGGIYLWLLFCYEDISCEIEAFLGPLMSDVPTIDIDTLQCVKNTACTKIQDFCEEHQSQELEVTSKNNTDLPKKNLQQEIQLTSGEEQSLPELICEILENEEAELGYEVKWYYDDE